MTLPKSAIVVLDTLAEDGPLTTREISHKSDLAMRTVNFALRKLKKCNLCKDYPDLMDTRLNYYAVNPEKMREYQIDLDRWRTMSRVYLKIA
jgi:DNA-binding MarR family transcriptional regulator